MNLNFETYGLFPIGVMRFDGANIVTQQQIDELLSYDRAPNAYNTTSKENYVLDEIKYSNIKNFLTECANQYLQEIIKPEHDVKLYVTQTWLNYSKKDEMHHVHRHPNSYLSGVFYIKSSETDKIQFHNNNKDREIELPCRDFNAFNSTTWWLPATENTVLVFPSNFTHSVPPVENEEERVSIAFNTFLKGYIGDDRTLTGLHL